MTGVPRSSPSNTTSAAGCSHDWAARGPAPRGRMGPRVEHQPCPVSSTGRQATTAAATPVAGVPPQRGAGDAFRTSVVYLWVIPSTLGMWRQGFGEWLFPLQSPFSTAGLPAALEAAATGGSRKRPSVPILL
jgi:hypothetical protein